MKFVKIALIAVGMTLASGNMSAPAWAAGDAAAGKKVFNKCRACHKLKAGKKAIGPSLHALFGRKAGAYKGFKFSKDMKATGDKGLVWTAKTLDEFLVNPKKNVGKILGKKRGKIRMAFGGLKKAKDRDNLIAYLMKATK